MLLLTHPILSETLHLALSFCSLHADRLSALKLAVVCSDVAFVVQLPAWRMPFRVRVTSGRSALELLRLSPIAPCHIRCIMLLVE